MDDNGAHGSLHFRDIGGERDEDEDDDKADPCPDQNILDEVQSAPIQVPALLGFQVLDKPVDVGDEVEQCHSQEEGNDKSRP